MPHTVGVREAKAKLSALLSRVRRGETITITDRGAPVARLVPIPEARAPLEERVRELEAIGWISQSDREARPLPEPLGLGEADLAQRYLREDRDAR